MHKLKLTAALGAVLAITSGINSQAGPTKTRVWVKFKAGSSAQVESALRGAGGTIHHRFLGLRAFAVTVPQQALAGLRRNPRVEYIEEDVLRYAFAETVPYGIPKVQAPQALSVGADGTGIKVCVIDSGIHAGHEEFQGVALDGYNSGASTPWNTDSCGHGSHVAGTIAAAGGNGKGVVGVSPGRLSMHIVKVFDGASCGWSYSSNLVDAATRCKDAGARIINMSLGGPTPSATEESAFDALNAQGLLSIAAAGNAGTTAMSYPASYPSVMSVAATDSNNGLASFSQQNSQVEIAAPGVGVLSTYPLKSADVVIGDNSYLVSGIEGSMQARATAAMVNGGRCTAAGSWSGNVVLCERGDISFAAKVQNVTAGGGVGTIIYNNVSGGFSGTLGPGGSSTIPAVSMDQETGLSFAAAPGKRVTVSTVPETNAHGYAYLNGTSMATPHVAGVAALVWSADPTKTNQQVRNAMTGSAVDLGSPGRDDAYGYGLVQALAAIDLLTSGTLASPSGLTATAGGISGERLQVSLAWAGGAATVDVYRNTRLVASALRNNGGYADSPRVIGAGGFSYKVCNAGSTSACSNPASVEY